MNIYISADMEGLSGVASDRQVTRGNRDYERARKRMTREVNALINALFLEGVDRVVVNDSHANMENILIEEFDSRAELISGSPKPFSMMEGIDRTFDAVFF
jgi:D-amino peptidase